MKGTLMRLRLLLAACFLLWASGLSFANSPQLENEELWIVPPPSFKRARRLWPESKAQTTTCRHVVAGEQRH